MADGHAREMLARRLREPPGAAIAADSIPMILMSIKPRYAGMIERGEKQVEFRRRFPAGVDRGRVIFYVSSPVRAIGLLAEIAAVARGTVGELWGRFGADGGSMRAELDEYFAGADSGVAVVLGEVREVRPMISARDARLTAVGFRPPQSWVVLGEGSVVRRIVEG